MSDFFNKDKDNMDDQNQDQNQIIEINGRQYSQDDLNSLIGLGEQTRELESKWNTKIDRLMPEYTKTTQELAELRRAENERLKAQEDAKKLQEQPADDNQLELEETKKLLKGKFGVITEDEFETRFKQRYTVERQAERLYDQLTNLASDINGEDGRPKFDSDEILSYMQTTGIPNPEAAYKFKYEKELDAWKEKQIQSVKKPGLFTQDSGNSIVKQPPTVKLTKDNLINAIKETMGE